MPTTTTEKIAAPSGSIRTDLLAVSLVIHLLGLALPLALLQVYDRILPSQSFGTATLLISGVAIAILLDAFLRYGRSRIFIDLGARYEARMTVGLFDRLLHADISELERRGNAWINDAVRAVSKIRDISSGQAAVALYEIPFVFVYIGLIAYVAGWLAWIPALLFVVAFIAALVNKRATEKAAEDVEREERRRQDLVWNLASGVSYFKSMGSEAALGRLFNRANDALLASNTRLESRNAFVTENSGLLSQLATILIVFFGAQEVIDGNLTTGGLAAATLLAGRSIMPAMASLGFLSRLAQSREAQARVDELLHLPLSPALNHDGGTTAIPQELKIELSGAGIENGQVEIDRGEIVHLDCEDASYASRVLADIAGLARSSGIEIKLNGEPQEAYAADAYRQAVCLVPRLSTLLPGSILNNLTLYDPRYNASAREYTEKLGLESHINSLRNGILTDIGPTAAQQLNEGAYQRISLIRALVRQPSILLLDHAASGLDLDGLKRLAAVLGELRGKTTVIIATYKTPLIEACDRTLRVEEVRDHG
ncbi:MAG: ABC transporter transmembrane domain-containing protein [Gammaproteobacteria bacterium]